MRSYSDIEVRTIAAEYVHLPHLSSEPSLKRTEPAVHSEVPETIQFILDLEFESKFAALMRSIALRWPIF